MSKFQWLAIIYGFNFANTTLSPQLILRYLTSCKLILYRTPSPVPRPAGYEETQSLDRSAAIVSPHLSKRKSDAWILVLRRPFTVHSIQRRHSSATLARTPALLETTGEAISGPTSPPPLPLAPVLKPQRLPSIVDPATRRTSWRLSFSSDQRASRLRALSQDHGSSSELGARMESVQIGPLRWLRSQALPLLLPTSKPLKDSENLTPKTEPSADTDYGAVDGSRESILPPVHLHEMQISQRLASRGLHSHSSSPQLSSWGSQVHPRGYSGTSGSSHINPTVQWRHSRHTTSSGIVDLAFQAWENVVGDGISSFYPSTKNSLQLTPESLRHNLTSLLATKTSKTPFQGPDLKGR